MKRFLSIMLILCLGLSLLAGCATPNNEESAALGEEVAGSSQDNVTDSEGPQKVENMKDPSGSDDSGNGGAANTPGGNGGDNGNGGNGGDNGNSGNGGDNGNSGNGGEGEGEGSDDNGGNKDIDPEAEGSGYYKILCYNLKAMYYDYKTEGTKDQREGVANYIKQHAPALVGLQEIDCNNNRSFKYDQMEYLGKETGYHYYFCEAMNYGDYQYGTGFLSKYPIKDVKTVHYQVQDPKTTEKRAYSRAVIKFPEGDVVFYNTHLCTASATDPTKEAGQQFNEVLRAVYNEKLPTILTADYNLVYEVRSKMIDTSKVTQLNGGEDLIFFNDKLPIDDIYVRNLDYYAKESNGMSIFHDTHEVAPWSDHIPCWGYFKFKK